MEIFLERTDHLGELAEQEVITNVSQSFGMGAGIRLFRGERDGFVSTNDLSAQGLLQGLDQALGMLGLMLSSGPSTGPSKGFEGLGALRDFSAVKSDWLERFPSLAEATAKLLEGTARLAQHG